jgi:hypothetical protein
MFIVLYFSIEQAKGFNLDIETKVLNDLDGATLSGTNNPGGSVARSRKFSLIRSKC